VPEFLRILVWRGASSAQASATTSLLQGESRLVTGLEVARVRLLGMSAEYDVARQQRLRRALEAIADAYGFTGELRRERIGEWWLYPSAIGYDREQEIAHQHGLEVKVGKEKIDEFRQLVAEAQRNGS
jgi:hypothetical protein